MKPLSEEQKEKLNQAVDSVCDLVSQGANPNQAIVKVASDMGLTEDYLPVVVHAYNNGAASAHRDSSNTLQEKSASFNVADPDAINQILYGTNTVKTASAPNRPRDYLYDIPVEMWCPPTLPKYDYPMTKSASATISPVLQRAKENAVVENVKYLSNAAIGQTERALESLQSSITKLAAYMLRSDAPRPQLLADAAEAKYGELGAQLVKQAYAKVGNISRSVYPKDPIMRSNHPFFNEIDNVMKAHTQYQNAKVEEDNMLKVGYNALTPIVESQAKHSGVLSDVEQMLKRGESFRNSKKKR